MFYVIFDNSVKLFSLEIKVDFLVVMFFNYWWFWLYLERIWINKIKIGKEGEG